MIGTLISGMTGPALISGLLGEQGGGRLTLAAIQARLTAMGASAFYLPSVYADAKATYYGDGDVSIASVGDPVGLVFDQLYTDRLGIERFDITLPSGLFGNITINPVSGTITHNDALLARVTFGSPASSYGWLVGKVVKVRFTATGLTVGTAGYSALSCFSAEATAARTAASSASFIRYLRVSDSAAGLAFAFAGGSSSGAILSGNSTRLVSGVSARQVTESNRPALAKAGVVPYFSATSGQSLLAEFPATVGASCTIAHANPLTGAAVITTGVNIGTTYSMSQSHSGLAIFPRALNADETAQVTAIFTQLARTVAV
jgi:hypothetical protein